MKKYALKCSNDEIIAYTKAFDLSEAQTKFSLIKVLELHDLLRIYQIEEVI